MEKITRRKKYSHHLEKSYCSKKYFQSFKKFAAKSSSNPES
jgi:hypothetical protein